MNRTNLMCLIGEPGVGKGTLAAHFQLLNGYVRISTGDILREKSNENTEEGTQIKELLSEGKFISDDIVCRIIAEYLEKILKNNSLTGVVFDGFPRSSLQVDYLVEFAKKHKDRINFKHVLLLQNVVHSELRERLLHRLTCKACGTAYVDTKFDYFPEEKFKDSPFSPYMRNKTSGDKCDLPFCFNHGHLVSRADDLSLVTIENRLRSTDAVLPSICMNCAKRNLLRVLDGSKSVFEIYIEACRYLS